MENISSTAELLEAIEILEFQQAGHLQQVRDNFYLTRESFRPVNLVGNAVNDFVSSPNLVKNILGIALGLFTGYLSGKVINIGSSNSKYRRIFGNVIKFGIASIVARNPNATKSIREFFARRFTRNRNKDLQGRDERN